MTYAETLRAAAYRRTLREYARADRAALQERAMRASILMMRTSSPTVVEMQRGVVDAVRALEGRP
jgi:hypothetical protein